TNENIDVRPQAAAFVTNVETDAGRTLFECLNDFAHGGGFDGDVLVLELREEGEQVTSQVYSRHGQVK
ncbi:MAG TPA: hypothetical protein PKA58_24250, partial [Polyangium sp.]|nr:hypothetical protein [Polyangium sp.]